MSTTAKTIIVAGIFAASIAMAPVLLATTQKNQVKHPAEVSQMTQGKMMQGKKGASGMMGKKGMSGMHGKKGMSGTMSKKGMSGTMNKGQMMKKMAKMHKMMHKMMKKCQDMDMKGAKSSHHSQVKHAK